MSLLLKLLVSDIHGSLKLEERATGQAYRGRVLEALPFLFISFGNHQLAEHLAIGDK